MEQGILVVSFGTTYRETREKNIDAVVAKVQKCYPDIPVWQAFSSPTVRRILKSRDGIVRQSLSESLMQMKKKGITHAYILPTHVIDGIESNKLKEEAAGFVQEFEVLSMAQVLLEKEEDYPQLAKALWTGLKEATEQNTEKQNTGNQSTAKRIRRMPVILMGDRKSVV